MRTLVDTCVLSEVRHPQGNPLVRKRFQELDDEHIYLSVLTIGELKKGIEKLASGTRKKKLTEWFGQIVAATHSRILPIELETAQLWGELTAQNSAKGTTIPAIDGLIAATAIQHGLQLMTRNSSDFEPTGVRLFNPWEDRP
ncbi:MAG: type II toxin-antitoxin system VapC family toxin [Pirellulales bacterium]